MTLADYGFCPAEISSPDSSYLPARIIAQERGCYRIASDAGILSATVSGRFRHEVQHLSDFPAVGDFVWVTLSDEQAVIHQVMPRKSLFLRKAAGTSMQEQVVAANVDILFLCMALNNDFNLRRLERYLAIAWDSGSRPVVLLTKADLCDDLLSKLATVEQTAIGADVLVTCSMTEDGLDQLMPYLLPRKTAAFIGSSGVGKSTLINRLLGKNLLATNGLRNDDKGRHTTTHRSFIPLSNGALVIDTPGMRELGMWDAETGIDTVFSDIEDLQMHCRFRNCTHGNEPGCAIQQALVEGSLSPERWQAYQKLCTENEFALHTTRYLQAKEQKMKAIALYNKKNRKH